MSLPWEEEKDGAKSALERRAAGMVVAGPLLSICGAVVIGVGGASVLAEGETLDALSGAWSASGNSSANALAVNLLRGAIFAGGAMVAVGLLGTASHFVQNRLIAVIALCITVLASGVMITGAVLFGQLVTRSQSVLIPNAYDAGFDAEQTALADLASAVHNQCCIGRFANDESIPAEFRRDFQGLITSCPEEEGLNPSVVCGEMPEILERVDPDLVSNLCTCFDKTVYFNIEKFVLDEDLCTKLEATEVLVGDTLTPPGVATSLDSALQLTQYSDYLPIVNFAMTGAIAPRTPAIVNGEPSPRDVGEEGFNCGLGYVKGVAWIQSLYLEKIQDSIQVVLFIVAATQLLIVILVPVYWMLNSPQDEEDWMAYTNKPVTVRPPEEEF